MKKTAIVIGAGSAGLIAAKELKEKGFEVKILEGSAHIGGIWSALPWKSYTLTSSKWVTEFGCFPMPDAYPDFVTNEHMLEYLNSFADAFGLKALIDYDVRVAAIDQDEGGRFRVLTDRGVYADADFVVVSTGLHGKPFIPEFTGLAQFKGEVWHSSKYERPDPFSGKRVLCVGMGESGLGLVAELASVAEKLVVSSTGVALAPRVIKGSQNPFDQMQFWPLGRYMIGYQELLTSGLSWFYRRIPRFLKKINITTHLKFYSYYGVKFDEFEKWFPKALIPHHFHVKFWAKPRTGTSSGNLTRTDAPPDDVFYLIKTGKIIPKGQIAAFEDDRVSFTDGSSEQIDTVVFNTGFVPGCSSLRFPGGWGYRHLDLFKGCIHPKVPNLAFVGMVRPTIGSIPAMAEMHARVVAAFFSGSVPLPPEPERLAIIARDNREHRQECPHIHERFPHIYFFDEWMERMAQIIGARPRMREHLGSVANLRAFFFGAPIPLRYRMRGEGRVENAMETYARRVEKVWGNGFGRWATATVLTHFLMPYALTLAAMLIALNYFALSPALAVAVGAAFYLLYRYVDFFRYIFEIGIVRPLAIGTGIFFRKRLQREEPNYEHPQVFQTLK